MSINDLDRFFGSLMGNLEMQAKVKSFGSDIDALAAYARESGYDVSAEELREYREKAAQLLKSKMKKQSDDAVSTGIKEFFGLIKLAEDDKDVAKRLAELGSGTPEELIAYGKEMGFIFTEQDIEGAGKSILETSDELSDEELERVAGGTVAGALLFLAFAAGMTALVYLAGGMVAVAVLVGD